MFALRDRVASDAQIDENDTVLTKTALEVLGFYPPSNAGITSYPDKAMFDGIRRYQQHRDLQVDGIMRVEGPTFRSLSKDLSAAIANVPVPDEFLAEPVLLDCEAQLAADEKRCKRFPRALQRAVCWAAAYERYNQCRRGKKSKPLEVDPDL